MECLQIANIAKEMDLNTPEEKIFQLYNEIITCSHLHPNDGKLKFSSEKLNALLQAKEVIKQNELNRNLVNKTNSLAISTWVMAVGTLALAVIAIFQN
jgi:hypothetical protein